MPNWSGEERRQDSEMSLIIYKIEEMKSSIGALNSDIEKLDSKVEKINGIKTDINWLKKIMFVIIPSLLATITGLVFLFIKLRN